MLPLVPSMIVPPGLSSPSRSASSIIFTAMRSLMQWPGLKVSTLAYTVAATSRVMRFRRTSGVLPMVSRMLSCTLCGMAGLVGAGFGSNGATFGRRVQALQGRGDRGDRSEAYSPPRPLPRLGGEASLNCSRIHADCSRVHPFAPFTLRSHAFTAAQRSPAGISQRSRASNSICTSNASAAAGTAPASSTALSFSASPVTMRSP